jgi:hypothetical protein
MLLRNCSVGLTEKQESIRYKLVNSFTVKDFNASDGFVKVILMLNMAMVRMSR